MTDCVLALDAGGTKTTCWLVARDGTVLGAGRGGPGNHILGTMDVVRTSFRTAIDDACAAAGVSGDAVQAVVAGCAGIEATGETRGPVERLLEECVPAAQARMAMGDMVTAFHGALPRGIGVVVNAGTGAVTYGENGAGRAVQVDGWGSLFGDDGSAYAIGRAALRAAAKALDGRGAETSLVDAIPRALETDSMPAAAYLLYGGGDTQARVAGLARTVSEAADAGDAVARDLLAAAARDLAHAAATALERLELADSGGEVATVGSVFRAGAWVEQPFHDALRRAVSGARVVPVALPPVGGAAKLAWRAVGFAWDDAAVARARATQP